MVFVLSCFLVKQIFGARRERKGWRQGEREKGMGRDREGKSERESARESLENLLFCWRPEKCFPNFSKLGTEIYKPSCTAHIPQVQSPCVLDTCNFFFFFTRLKFVPFGIQKSSCHQASRAMPVKKGIKLTWQRGMPHCQKEGGLF